MKLCPYPFSRLQTSNYEDRFEEIRGTFLPCVPSWFKENYFKIPHNYTLDDIWNGEQARELRKKMYEGDFSFCNREACQIPLFSIEEMSDPNMLFLETPISPENLKAIIEKNPIMPVGPSSIYLTSDFTCNLKCPICRSELITNGPPTASALEEFNYVQKHRSSLEVIKFANGGEVFYSKLQRALLKSINKNDFPKIRRIHIVSNGTLFNSKAYEELAPGSSFIKDVNISIDAGSKAIYEKVRGPYWEQVCENIEWLGRLRYEGKLDYYSFHVIITKDNFRDIPNMVELGKLCRVDRILVQPYLNGPGHGYKDYFEQAIHLPSHPEYSDFVNLMLRFKDEPIFYTYLDLPGFNKKIEIDVNIQKAWAYYLRADEFMKMGQFLAALDFINHSIELTPKKYSYLKKCEILKELNYESEYYVTYEIAKNIEGD